MTRQKGWFFFFGKYSSKKREVWMANLSMYWCFVKHVDFFHCYQYSLKHLNTKKSWRFPFQHHFSHLQLDLRINFLQCRLPFDTIWCYKFTSLQPAGNGFLQSLPPALPEGPCPATTFNSALFLSTESTVVIDELFFVILPLTSSCSLYSLFPFFRLQCVCD